jgi:hypothetical protein
MTLLSILCVGNELLSLVNNFCRTCSSNFPPIRLSISLISVISRCIDLNVMMVVCSAMVICRAKCSFHTRFCSSSSKSLPIALRCLVCMGSIDCSHLRGLWPLCLISSLKVFCISTSDLSFSHKYSFKMCTMMSRAVNFSGSRPSPSLSLACSIKKVCWTSLYSIRA